ncbi:MAG: hypothetical protein IJK53_05425 [Erysipelotrichaceae bacterium]|nr:hypothetical protein [Erysipelotrichaceae bacterium]
MTNVLNFTDEDAERLAAEENKMLKAGEFWENLNEKQIVKELFALNTQCNIAARGLKDLVRQGNYEDVEETIYNLFTKGLSQEGWLRSFHKTNIDVFPRAASDYSRPDWYVSLSPTQKTSYDACLQYHHDSMWLLNTCEELRQVLLEFDLEGAYKILLLEQNMKEANMNKDYYKKIDKEVSEISELINLDWDKLEAKARKAEEYYKRNAGAMEKSALNRGYRQERIKDYQDIFSQYEAFGSFAARGDGNFNVRPSELAKLSVIDKYTVKVVDLQEAGEAARKTIDKCERIKSGNMAESIKNTKTEACKSLAAAFDELLGALTEFAYRASTVQKLFEKADDEEPYCYMKLLDSLNRFRSNYSFSADVYGYDPVKNGTKFAEMYKALAKAIGEHCQDFVYKHGHTGLSQ